MTRDELLAIRTSDWTQAERAELADIVGELRPSVHHLGDALDWLDDIAARDGARSAAVLADPTLRAALAGSGSAPDRWKRWKEALRRLRYPRLVARERAFRDAVRELDLGRGAAVAPPADLEGGVVTLTLRIASADDVMDHVERLVKAHRSGAWSRLFDVLD
jgi:hypothetical protein